MIERSVLVRLIGLLAVLLVSIAVVLCGYALVAAAHDATGALALWWIIVGLLLLTGIDLVAIVAVLAIRELDRPDEPLDE